MPIAATKSSDTLTAVKINLERVVDLIEESTVKEQLDLGSALMYKLLHPTLGSLVLVNSAAGDHGLMHLN